MNKAIKVIGAVSMPVILYIVFTFAAQGFGGHSISVVLSQTMIPLITGFGMAMTMIAGLIDFSPGVRILFAAMAGALLELQFGIPGLIVGCIGGGLLGGVVIAVLYRVLKIPSMVLSLGILMIFEVITAKMAGSLGMVKISNYAASIGSYPYNLLFAAGALVLFYLIYYKMKIGSHVRAVGNDELMAAEMGINVAGTKFNAYILSGLFCGIAAILQICYSGIISAQIGMSTLELVFKPMMGVMIAMELLKLIDNFAVLILVGELTISILFNGFIAMGLSDTVQNIFLGAFLLLVMAISSNRAYLAEKRGRMLRGREIQASHGGAVK